MTPTVTLDRLLRAAERDAADHVAVLDGGRICTYARLGRHVRLLAASLDSAGVRPRDRVVVFADKSLEAIVAIHAILRLGACYVPIDVTQPTARTASIVDRITPAAVVTTTRRQGAWASAVPTPVPLVLADALIDGPDGPATTDSAEGRGPFEDDLAYILHTSGSTGEPKGVMLTHANAAAFVDWAHECFGVVATDRVASHAPLHFDLSIFDVFTTVAARATLLLLPKRATALPAELSRALEENGATILYAVPTALRLLRRGGALDQRDLSSLRLIMFAGEVLPTAELFELMTALPATTFWNLYGPTETNVCTAHHVRARPEPGDPPTPIGRPVAGCTTTVSEEGELLVAGPSVSPGYWGDPGLSAERFTSDPDGGRWYRTGDRVEVAGPLLHFVGRIDDQVKVRGHRVEPAEIEQAMTRLDGVTDVAVVGVDGTDTGARLVAFVVLGPPDTAGEDGEDGEDGDPAGHLTGPVTDERSLRVATATVLPPYLCPERIVFVDALPTTATTKVDRLALRDRAVALLDS